MTYEVLAERGDLRALLNEWPGLANFIFDATREDRKGSKDGAGDALMNDGLVGLAAFCAGPRGDAVKQNILEVLMALRGQEFTAEMNESVLRCLAAMGSTPRTVGEWRAFSCVFGAFEPLDSCLARDRLYAGFDGSWVRFLEKLNSLATCSVSEQPDLRAVVASARPDAL